MSEGRAREFSFTDPLFAYAIVPAVPKGTTKVRKLEDLRIPGLRAAVGTGGFDTEFISKNIPEANVSAFPPDDPNLSMLEVKARRAATRAWPATGFLSGGIILGTLTVMG
jgi:hypothetical protein